MKNQNLIALRKNNKMSVAGMAGVIGISESYYEKIEHGTRAPSYNFLVKFKKAFPNEDAEQIFLSQNHTLCVDE